MCIAFFTLSQPGYKLILASNRDEFLSRPTLPAGWHNFPSFPPVTKTDIEDRGDHLTERGTPVTENGKDEKDQDGWVLSGLDRGKAEGGTWLGITRDLKVGLLTNVRLTPPTTPFKPSINPPSRGLLLKDFLSSKPSSSSSSTSTSTTPSQPVNGSTADQIGVHDYLASHYAAAGEYEGFNLLLFSLRLPGQPDSTRDADGTTKNTTEVGYLTNRPSPCLTDLHIPPLHPSGSSARLAHSEPQPDAATSPSEPRRRGLPAQCFGISNSPMSEPWPKVVEGEKRMQESLLEWAERDGGDDGLVERMFGVLGQCTPIKSEDDMKSSTTIPLIRLPPAAVTENNLPAGGEAEGKGTSGKPKYYGTRTSTIILVKDSGQVVFVERDINELGPDGEPRKGQGERKFEFIAQARTHS